MPKQSRKRFTSQEKVAVVRLAGRVGAVEGAVEEDVARHVTGVTNILRTIGAISGRPERVAPPTVVKTFDWLRSPVEGIFHCHVKVDQVVKARELVGEMTDLVGEPIAALTAPVSGVVLFAVTSPAIKKGGLLVGIGAL